MTKAELLALLDDSDIQQRIRRIIGLRPVTADEVVRAVCSEDNECWRLADILTDPPPAAGPSAETDPPQTSPVS